MSRTASTTVVTARRHLVALVLTVIVPAAADSQTATATLSGVVVDQSEAVVPDVTLTLVNSATALERQTLASKQGNFTFPFVPPGQYSLTAQRDGFAPSQVRDVVLNVGDNVVLRMSLKVGQVTDTVSVVADARPTIASGTLATIVDRQFIAGQPLNGRSFQTLIGLTPGVVFTPANVVTQGQFSVNGQRTSTNYFTVDGVSANFGSTLSQSLYETSSGAVPSLSALGSTNTLASADAVEEFAVQTSTVAPEYGRTPGAQVGMVTRSGTSTFHGDAFEYFRHDTLNANDWFAIKSHVPKPPLRQHDFGGVLGGPLMLGRSAGRDRTFFFLSYEGLRVDQPAVSAPEPVPTAAARQQASGVIRSILSAFPLPNQPASGDPLTGTFVGSYANPSALDATSIRIDHRVGDRLTLFGRYNYAPSKLESRATFTSAATISHSPALTETTTAGATLTLTPRAVNDLRVNFSRSKAYLTYTSDDFGGAVAPANELFLPPYARSEKDSGNIVIGSNLGVTLGPNSLNTLHQINVIDAFSVARGAHAWKFGVDYRRTASTNVVNTFYRSLIFDDVAAVLSGRASSLYIGDFGGALFPVYTNVSAYGQDTWRASDRLTLTYGARYDVNPAPGEKNGLLPRTIENLDPNHPERAELAPPGTPFYRTTYNNVAPRIGASYRIRRDRETVVRGGFGVFYDLGSQFTGNGYNPFVFDVYTDVPLDSPLINARPSPLGPTTLDSTGQFLAFQPGYKLPYTLQYNVALDQPIGAGVITAAYVGAAGRRLGRLEKLPEINGIYFVSNSATSDYNALQLQYRRRLSGRLQALASYTFAHSNDIVSDVSILNLQVPLQRYDPSRDRGPSDFDVRHSLSAAVSVGPSAPGGSGVLAALGRDWSVDSIVRARSATPINITTGLDLLHAGLGNTSRPDLVPGAPVYLDDPDVAGGRRISAAAFSVPAEGQQGTLGRNALRGFAAWQVDISVKRSIPLGNGLRLEAGVDVFNVFNHANFANPIFGHATNVLNDPNFGVSTQMLGQALGGLSPLYQIGGPRSAQLSAKVRF